MGILRILNLYGIFLEKLGFDFAPKKLIYFYIISAPYIYFLFKVSDFNSQIGWRFFLLCFFIFFNPIAHLFMTLYLSHYGAIKKSKEIFLISNKAWVIPF